MGEMSPAMTSRPLAFLRMAFTTSLTPRLICLRWAAFFASFSTCSEHAVGGGGWGDEGLPCASVDKAAGAACRAWRTPRAVCRTASPSLGPLQVLLMSARFIPSLK